MTALLKQRRKELGLRQIDLARKIGKDRSLIARFESGKVSISARDFLLIAQILKLGDLPLRKFFHPSQSINDPLT